MTLAELVKKLATKDEPSAMDVVASAGRLAFDDLLLAAAIAVAKRSMPRALAILSYDGDADNSLPDEQSVALFIYSYAFGNHELALATAVSLVGGTREALNILALRVDDGRDNVPS